MLLLTNNYIHCFTVELLEVQSLIRIISIYFTAHSEINIQLKQINVYFRMDLRMEQLMKLICGTIIYSLICIC